MNHLKVGIIGIGTVGGGVLEVWRRQRSTVARQYNLDIDFVIVGDRDADLHARIAGDIAYTADHTQVTGNPDIQVVIELIGGLQPALTIARNTLKSGKRLVTANKALLANHGEELFALAAENKSEIGFEASVCGSIPVIRTILTGMAGNEFRSVYGIVNGTCNFILTKMHQEGMEFADALKEAQRLGFAEANPAFDIEGTDAQQKILILTWLLFGKKITLSDVLCQGIVDISALDMHYAAKLGYIVKLLGIAKQSDAGLECRVHPTMIPENHILAHVVNETNAVSIESEFAGPTTLIGKGAGKLPTASAVWADIIYQGQRLFSHDNARHTLELAAGTLRSVREIESRYYLRIHTDDKPGVLAKITTLLGNRGISISQMMQEENHAHKPVDVIIVTHPAQEGNIQDALDELEKLSEIKKRPALIRVED